MYLSAQGKGFLLRKQNEDPAVGSSSMHSVKSNELEADGPTEHSQHASIAPN